MFHGGVPKPVETSQGSQVELKRVASISSLSHILREAILSKKFKKSSVVPIKLLVKLKPRKAATVSVK